MKKLVILIILPFLLNCIQSIGQETTKKKEEKVQPNFLKFFAELDRKALAEKFKGIQTSDGEIANLFPIRSTGVSTAPITDAAKKFLNSLNQEQLARTTFDIDDPEWRKWSNVDNGIFKRQGISLKEMSTDQKESAFSLMQESLSAKGLQLSKDIMKTDHTLAELNNRPDIFSEELYFFTVMGTPSTSEPWGWQLDGHHLVINYFVMGDQIVMSPVFMGGEPILTTTGKYAGNTLFQDEQNMGLSFMQSLTSEQQQKATLEKEKKHNDNKAEAFKDNIVLEYEGLSVARLSEEKKQALLKLISQYVGNMKEGHRKIRMDDIKDHLNDTWFAWNGTITDDAVFYYRIHSPVVLIEFDHQGVVGVPNVEHRGPTRNHIHTVVRTPNGNDYGKDLLKQHLEKAHQN
ncbi:DUF3500 domain-containing protein [Maribacter sp. CXY002]|uniref:DUF3500 domain-containing protein n=1 Tax=Maribacter luteocoastalis TaxID=3407671 RepID=UPI003B67CAAE